MVLSLPMTPLADAQFAGVSVPDAGATFTGAALVELISCIDRDVRHTTDIAKGDWRPLVFLMTDGGPSDLYTYRQAIPQLKARNPGTIIACAAGPKAKKESLLELTDRVVSLDTMDSAAFSSFFKWVSASVAAGTVSAGIVGQTSLPPPPPIRAWDESRVTDSDEEVVSAQCWREIRQFMWNFVGIVRTTKRLERAQHRIDLLSKEVDEYYGNFRVTPDLIELRNLLEVARLVVRSALHRKESRGLHYTLDYPETLAQAVDTVLAP